jgi:hypothetical protein
MGGLGGMGGPGGMDFEKVCSVPLNHPPNPLDPISDAHPQMMAEMGGAGGFGGGSGAGGDDDDSDDDGPPPLEDAEPPK